MKELLLVLLVLVVQSTLCYSHLQLEKEWFSWKRQHAKVYSYRDESSKWKVWRENYQKIQEHNKANHSFSLELNEFADMTQEEFAYFYLSTPRDVSEFPRSGIDFGEEESAEEQEEGNAGNNANSDTQGKYSSSIDWRDSGYVTSVKNQGQCGSCWAFSATGALEGQMARSKGKLVSLSEQQLVDCSWNYGNAGCKGGLMDYAFKYIMSNGGICSASDYPYLGYDNKWNCKSSKCSSVAYCKGYTDVYGEDNLAKAVSKYGPVSVAIDASSYQFQFYSSGVYSDSSCSASNLNHGVLVVGYGASNSNKYYWLVKNSWGTSWGVSGYVYMAKGQSNMCGIASAASYPKV